MSETQHLKSVEQIAADVVAKNATHIDKSAEFPAANLQALAEAGLLGLVSASAVGGMGLGMRAAAEVVERLARECGSTAMVLSILPRWRA